MQEEYPVALVDLPSGIRGFVTLGSDYQPCIVINSRMTKEQQQKTYIHEIKHIERGDMYNEEYHEYKSESQRKRNGEYIE